MSDAIMSPEEVIAAFKKAGGLLEGHFVYTSGSHGRQFLQAARVVQYPEWTEQLCRTLAGHFGGDGIDLVCGPATGGIVLAYETARHLGCRAVFSEKDEGGTMAVKRGLRVDAGCKVLVVEDVTTTGGSIQKTIDHLGGRGANVAGVGVLIDRSGGAIDFEARYVPLARLEMETWDPADCALCKQGVPLVEPDDIVV